MTLRKTFEGDLKKMELTWGTAESESKDRNSWRKEMAALFLMDRRNKRRRYILLYVILKMFIRYLCSF